MKGDISMYEYFTHHLTFHFLFLDRQLEVRQII